MDDDADERDDTKRRSRNLSEKKRRDQFNSLVNDLSALISSSSRKMDKSTVLKSTIAFLKHHNEATDRSKVFEIQHEWKPSFLSNDEFTQLMLESLDGFIIVFGSRGPIFYTSDSVTAQLGYLPCDLLKMTIFDLAYEMDHEILLNVFLNPKPVIEPAQTDISARNQITFFLHLKRGDSDDRDGNSYELVKFVGYFRNDANVEAAGQNTHTALPRVLQRNSSTIEVDQKLVFVGTGRLQMPQMIREITLSDPTCSEFTSKHSMEWKFLFLDHRAPPIIGYMPFEVLGTSGYDYYHFDDIDEIVSCHDELMQAGKGKSGFYRFLTKGQQWIWLQTDFYVSYNQFNAKPDYVVCTHKVINYMDVLKYHKSEQPKTSSNAKTSSVAIANSAAGEASTTTSAAKSTTCGSTAATSTVAVTSTTPNNLLTANSGNTSLCSNANTLGDIIGNENSPSMDAGLWTNAPTPTGAGSCHLQPMKSGSRPASSYGNISSTGVSPNVKRKRYMYHSRGNESDSTSMSADSGTSRQSLMTHMSSSRQRLASSSLPHSNFSGSLQQQQHQQHSASANQHHSQSHYQHQHHHQPQHQLQQQQHPQLQQSHQHHHTNSQQIQMNNNSQTPGQKLFQSLPHHALVAGSTMSGSGPCQFTQPTFPIRSPQIVAPSFIESPQYLTAIPVQPVIAPFQVAPVISPLPNQHEMLAGPVVMTSTQSQLQEQLQRKHDDLQKLIIQQQDELRIVSEQLLLARYTLLQPMMSMNYGQGEAVSMGNTTRNFNFNNNAVQQQFNQYGFAMNSSEMENQQMMLQQQQNLQQQMQHNQAQQHQTTNHLLQQGNTQHSQQSQAQTQVQAQSQGQHDQMLMNRSVPDLDQLAQEEFDAFLSLSPLQNIEIPPPINSNQLNTNPSTSTTLANASNVNTPNSSATNPSVHNAPLMETLPFKNNTNNPTSTSDDSLFSYMQMATETSPNINFNMTIDDGLPETQSDDIKRLSTARSGLTTASQQQSLRQNLPMTETQSTQLTTQQRRNQRSPFYSSHPFSNLSAISSQTAACSNSANVNSSSAPASATNDGASTSTLPNELDRMLPYQLGPEPSPILFNSNSHTSETNQ